MKNENEAPEHGICKFKTVHIVTTYTSGNELRGTPVRFGEYDSAMVARQALADDGFTNGQFGWRKGYSDATIEKVVKHYDYSTDLSDAKDKRIEELEAKLALADVLATECERAFDDVDGTGTQGFYLALYNYTDIRDTLAELQNIKGE